MKSTTASVTLPANAYLVAGSITTTSGAWGLDGNTLTWGGGVPATGGVTITYAMTVSSVLTQPTTILNMVSIDDGGGLNCSCAALV